MKLSEREISILKDYLLELGVRPSNVVSVYRKGSSLYVQDPNDLDLMVFTKDPPAIHRAPRECVCVLRGLRLDVNVYSASEFDHIEDYEQHNFVHEEGDWEIIYGRPNAVRFHKLDLGEELTKFKAVLFDPYSQDYYPRRLVSFFVLARKLGYDVPQDLIERAHRDEIDPADYRAFFYILFTKYSPKIHHEK